MNIIFPIIGHVAKPVSKILIKLPVTPNQITSASLTLGLVGSFFFISNEFITRVAGSLIFVISYILDNCDGEVARHKNLTSNFGEKFDTFSDWLIHTVFFVALGYGVARETSLNFWLWLGIAASAGATMNYFIQIFSVRSFQNAKEVDDPSKSNNLKETLAFIFRELFRADFCFIVLIFSVLNLTWLLLPVAAIGAQIYWLIYFWARGKC